MSLYRQYYYPEASFGGFSDIDATVAFYTRVKALVSSSSVVLDIGCGRGQYQNDPIEFRRNVRILHGHCAKVIGIDVDTIAATNPFIDEFLPITTSEWPIDSESIDLCCCDWVLEHVPDPLVLFRESRRVLKPGGVLCIRTQNKRSYSGVVARLIPSRLHGSVLRWAQKNRESEDVFPTVYRCNTVRDLKVMMKSFGFESVVYGYESEPAYLEFSKLAFGMAARMRSLIPPALRTSIFAFGRKL
jgi:ubiquinone/menaquinone biosynthesis C-methylase UbiE